MNIDMKGISKLLDNNRISSRLPSDDHLSLIKNKLNEIEGLKVIDFANISNYNEK